MKRIVYVFCLFAPEEEALIFVVLVVFALVAGTLAVLAYENAAIVMLEVHLRLFGWHAPALPLGALLLAACLLGALLLYVVTVLSALRDRRALARLRRRVAELERAQGHLAPQQHSLPIAVPMPGIHPRFPR